VFASLIKLGKVLHIAFKRLSQLVRKSYFIFVIAKRFRLPVRWILHGETDNNV
jgi:hypothetical protein